LRVIKKKKKKKVTGRAEEREEGVTEMHLCESGQPACDHSLMV